MGQLTIKYGIDDKPPWLESLLFGLQWLAITAATAIIIGKVVAGFHFTDPTQQLRYMQKLFFVMAVAQFIQVLWGHRLPLITGPATVLLVGIVAGGASDIGAVYTAIIAGGVFLVVLGVTGLFAKISRFFTPRVVAVILILIALTMTPTILQLILQSPAPRYIPVNLSFALLFFLAMVIADRFLKGVWKSTMVVWAIILGSLVATMLVPPTEWRQPGAIGIIGHFFNDLTTRFAWDPGLLIAFFVCYIALSINDLGSMQSVGTMVGANAMPQRVAAGVALTGVANILAGFGGVIGPVNFSMSAGLIASNGNASRYTLIPTSIGLLATAFLPAAVAFIWNVPAVVVGVILLYIMSLQLAAGLMVAFGGGGFSYQDGLVIAIPSMVSVLVSYLPAAVKSTLPPLLAPIAGNAFVMAVIVVLLLEHFVFKQKPS